MAFQSVPDTAEVVVAMLSNQQRITMTFHALHVAGYDLTDLQNLADDMDDWAGAELKPLLSNQVTYIETEARGLEFVNDQLAVANQNTGLGGLATAPLTNHSCIAVKRISGFTGRSARGRVYFPLVATMVSGIEDFINSSDGVAIVAALNEVRTAMLNHAWFESVVSRFHLGALRTVGVNFAVTDYVLSDLEIDTQRRRMPSK